MDISLYAVTAVLGFLVIDQITGALQAPLWARLVFFFLYGAVFPKAWTDVGHDRVVQADLVLAVLVVVIGAARIHGWRTSRPKVSVKAPTASALLSAVFDDGFASYLTYLPGVLALMGPNDWIIVSRDDGTWPPFVQVTAEARDGLHVLVSEIPHPSVLAKLGGRVPDVSQETLDALLNAGWHEPRPGQTPNFSMRVPVADASELAHQVLTALVGYPAHDDVPVSINAWGPSFDRTAEGVAD